MPNIMTKSALLQTRLEPKLKEDAKNVLEELGISPSEAVTMFLRQVVMTKSIPFPIRVPNAETIAAIEELEAGRKAGRLKSYSGEGAFDEMMADIMSEKE